MLQDINLAVPKGSFVSLIGPSGCGKSTLLKVLAGLIRPTEGDVSIAGILPQEAAKARMIGLVFQDATLLPWKNAIENAAFLLMTADESIKQPDALIAPPHYAAAGRPQGADEKKCLRNFPAACVSGWRSPARSRSIRKCC